MDPFATISAAFTNLSALADWWIIGALAAVGVVSMALLDSIKQLTPVRRIFQHWWVGGWIADRCRKASSDLGRPISPVAVEKTLIDLATGGDERAFYELAAEQLTAQMNAAAQAALDYPKRYSDLLSMLAQGADASDIETLLNTVVPPGEAPSQTYLDARNRVANRLQRNLDGMQIALSSRWQFWMQFTAIVITILIVEAAVIGTGSAGPGAVLLAIPIGVVGGYIAPVARDLVAALKSLRG